MPVRSRILELDARLGPCSKNESTTSCFVCAAHRGLKNRLRKESARKAQGKREENKCKEHNNLCYGLRVALRCKPWRNTKSRIVCALPCAANHRASQNP